VIDPTEHETMQRIGEAIQAGVLEEPFRADDINRALGITRSGHFLAGHCQDTGRSTPRFIRVGVGIYRLRNSNWPTPSSRF
jgi:hypothetical protein